MTGVSLFLGYLLYEAQGQVGRPQVEANQLYLIYPNIQGNKLSVRIKQGIINNQDINNQEEFCVLSVVNEGKQNEKQFYLLTPNSVKERKKENEDCPDKSKATPKEDGTWMLEYEFSDEKKRTIRVEKIANKNSDRNNYIDFTIGESN